MAWLYLILAGVLEACWPSVLGGWKNSWSPVVIAVIFAIPTLWLLRNAMDGLSVTTAYFVFIGIGAVGNVLITALIAQKLGDATRLLPIALIVLGILWLHSFPERQ